MSYHYLGKPHKLYDGLEKVTGAARYAADVQLPNMVFAQTLYSPYSHARIISMDKREAEGMEGVIAVLSADDLPTKDRLINGRNNAILARERVLWAGQPVAVVVAETPEQATDAIEAIIVEYEPLPVVGEMHAALSWDVPTLWPHGFPAEGQDMSSLHASVKKGAQDSAEPLNNVHEQIHFAWGDVAQGFAEADHIVEQHYRIPHVHQSYLEPHAVVAEPDLFGRTLKLYTTTQGMFLVRDEVAELLGYEASQVIVQPMTIGGAFGAKYGILEPLCAAVAVAVQCPVQMVLSRSEEFLTTTPAPAITIYLKTGAKRDDFLTAIEGKIWVDNGAFRFGHSGTIANLLGGWYQWPHLQLDGYEINTNKPQAGAYRAPGAPQAAFALESNMDEHARALGLDPLHFRWQNAAEGNSKTGSGERWSADIGLKKLLETLQLHPRWREREVGPNEGIGVAIGGWGIGTHNNEAICRVDSDGGVTIETGHTDISGNMSSFALIAAEVLHLSPDLIRLKQGDTTGPYAVFSGGSMVTYNLAHAVRESAEEAKRQLLAVSAELWELAIEDLEFGDGCVYVRDLPAKRLSLAEIARQARYEGIANGPIVGTSHTQTAGSTAGFCVQLVKIHVDPTTGVITPLWQLAVQDVGFALNPLLVEGQMHGGMTQSLGMALYEAMVFDEGGQLQTGTLMDYALPRADQYPPLETVLVENPSAHGPFGARGVGEPPMIAGAAACANAVRAAVGVRLTQLPLRPEAVWQALQAI